MPSDKVTDNLVKTAKTVYELQSKAQYFDILPFLILDMKFYMTGIFILKRADKKYRVSQTHCVFRLDLLEATPTDGTMLPMRVIHTPSAIVRSSFFP